MRRTLLYIAAAVAGGVMIGCSGSGATSAEELAKRVQVLEDTLAIQRLITTYTIGLDTENRELMKEVFSPDAKLDYGPEFPSVGPGSRFWENPSTYRERLAGWQHLMGNPKIIVEGDRARAWTNAYVMYTSNKIAAPNQTCMIGGRYEDVLQRINGRWLITERKVVWIWAEGNPIVFNKTELVGIFKPLAPTAVQASFSSER